VKVFIGTLVAIIFALLSLIHFYWAIGGVKGNNKVIPFSSGEDGVPVLKPGRMITILVAVILLTLSAMTLIRVYSTGDVFFQISPIFQYYFFNFIAALFLLRAIGDFKYIGMTKKVKNTEFSKWDNYLYIPLCIFISFAISFINH
jgi:hypothetical protein